MSAFEKYKVNAIIAEREAWRAPRDPPQGRKRGLAGRGQEDQGLVREERQGMASAQADGTR